MRLFGRIIFIFGSKHSQRKMGKTFHGCVKSHLLVLGVVTVVTYTLLQQ